MRPVRGLVLLVILGVLLARAPIVRRLAARSAVRRPREAVLVIIGSVLGTAIITGSFVVGDTLTASIRQLAHTQLGPVDEVMVFPDEVRWNLAKQQVEGFDDAIFDGIIPVATLPTPAAAADGDPRPTAPRAIVFEIDFEDARGFSPGTPTGLQGATPKPGHAAIAATVAKKLQVDAGDRIEVFVYGTSVELTVDRILPAVGIAGYTVGFGSLPDNIFVAPGFLRPHIERVVESDIAVQPPSYRILVSNGGGVESGAVHTEAAMQSLQNRFRGLDADFNPVKQNLLISADASGEQMTTLFTAMGAFGVLAGILLLVNVFAMLAEDRTSELGMMRAVGLRRRSLVAAFTLEGFGYALIASAIGAGLGVGLGKGLITLLVDAFGNIGGARDDFGFRILFRAQPEVISRGFAAGLVLSTLTVLVTSIRISRFDVIRAIRNLPEPQRSRRRPWLQTAGALAVGVGSVWAAVGVASNDGLSKLIGPSLMAIGFVPLLERVLGRTSAVTVSSFGCLMWSAVIMPFTTSEASGDIIPTIVQGVVLTTSGVVLVSFQQHRLSQFFRRFARTGNALAARMGLAYPVARRVRTGLTLAPFTIVVFTIAFVTMISTLITGQLHELRDTVGGDYDVVVRASATSPLPVEELAARKDVAAVAPLSQVLAQYTGEGYPDPVPGLLTGFDEQLAATTPPGLADRGEYRTDREAFLAVAKDPELIIVSALFFSNQQRATGGGVSDDPPAAQVEVGDPMTVIDPTSGESIDVRVAAIAAADVAFDGALYGVEGAKALFGGRVVPNRAYVKTQNTTFERFAAEVGQQFLANGVEAESIRELTDRIFSAIQGFIRLVQAFLGLGLIVGVTGIGVVMVRAVRERRRQIGMLRAVGFDAPMIGRIFVYEAGFVAVEGIILGVGLSLVVQYALVNSDLLVQLLGNKPPFSIPGWALLALASSSLVAALLATFTPARAAARIPPSEALRTVD